MIDDVAVGVLSTGTDARILTLVSDAGLVARTLVTDNAFRPTALVRIARILR